MKKLLFFVITLIFLGCGSNTNTSSNTTTSSISNTSNNSSIKVQFLDSPVAGLGYELNNDNNISFTDSNGYFYCKNGDKISFYIGKNKIGSDVECNKTIITPLDLYTNINNVKNSVALFQTLDKDNNPLNGITITKDTFVKFNYINLDLNNTTDLNNTVYNTIGKELVNPEKAYDNFLDNIFLLKSNSYNKDSVQISNFIDYKIQLVDSIKQKDYSKYRELLNQIYLTYQEDINSLFYIYNISSSIEENINNINADLIRNYQTSLNLIRKIIIKEIFDVNDTDLDKIIKYMDNLSLEDNIYINSYPIDNYTLELFKELNSSISSDSQDFNISSNVLENIPFDNYYNLNLSSNDLLISKKYLKYYFISKDENDFIKNINDFYNTNISKGDDIIKVIAEEENISSYNEDNIKTFIKNFINYNQNIGLYYSNLENNLSSINDFLKDYSENISYYFTDDNGVKIKDMLSGDLVVSPIIHSEDIPYKLLSLDGSQINFEGKDKFFDNILNFDLDEEGNIYSISLNKMVLKNNEVKLKDKDVNLIKVKNNKIYLLLYNGVIEVYDTNFNKLYEYNNNIIYNKIFITDSGYLYALRVDGKIDVYNNGSFLKTLNNDDFYVNMWGNENYLVVATNNGYLGIYNIKNSNISPVFEGYLNINPISVTLYKNKMFVLDKNLYIKYIDLENKLLLSKLEVGYFLDFFSRYTLLFDEKNNYLLLNDGFGISLFKIEDNNLILSSVNFNHASDIPYEHGDISIYNNYLYYNVYGAIWRAKLPTNIVPSKKGEVTNQSLSLLETIDEKAFNIKGNILALNTKTSIGKYIYEGVVYIPVISNHPGVYIFDTNKSKLYFLRLFGVPIGDHQYISFEKNNIIFSNYNNIVIFSYSDNKVNYKYNIPKLFNDEIGIMGMEPLLNFGCVYKDDNLIYGLTSGNLYIYDIDNKTFYYGTGGLISKYGEFYDVGMRFNNDLILKESYTVGFQSPEGRIIKNFFDKEENFVNKTDLPVIESNLDSHEIYYNLEIIGGIVKDLYTDKIVYEGILKDILYYEDKYYVLRDNDILVLDQNYSKIKDENISSTDCNILISPNYCLSDDKSLINISSDINNTVDVNDSTDINYTIDNNSLIGWFDFENGFSNKAENNETLLNISNINNVIIENGYLKLINNYDYDPRRYVSFTIDTTSTKVLVIEKKTKLTTLDNYTLSQSSFVNSLNENISIIYNNYHYNNGDLSHQINVNNSVHFYIENIWDYNDSNNFNYQLSSLLEPIWNEWFFEKIIINYEDNLAIYGISMDNINYKYVTLNNMKFTRDKNTTFTLSAWDWASGSEHDVDELKIYNVR